MQGIDAVKLIHYSYGKMLGSLQDSEPVDRRLMTEFYHNFGYIFVTYNLLEYRAIRLEC